MVREPSASDSDGFVESAIEAIDLGKPRERNRRSVGADQPLERGACRGLFSIWFAQWTVTGFETVALWPTSSTIVSVTLYVPAGLKSCCTTPPLFDVRSPKFQL